MATIYIDEHGAFLRTSQGLVVVEKDAAILASVRLQEIESVIVMENCALTSAAVVEMLRAGVEVAFLSRNAEYLGKLEPVASKNVAVRSKQHAASADQAFCLALSRRFVAAKIANMRTIVMRYARSHTGDDLAPQIDRLRDLARGAGSADTAQELLGIEGSATRHYFSALSRVISEPFVFSGRNRRPPLDPVNAMLGFAYALLENYVEAAVGATGLDPYCGFFHREAYGRQSLVFDLMEEMRPVIADSVVINCCNRAMVSPDADFERRDGGVYLNEPGRQKFFRAFHGRMNGTVKPGPGQTAVSYQRLCVAQAQALARCVNAGTPDYRPFLIK